MNDQDCVQFLQWSLPKLRMRWQGFRKVRGQVCKRIERRIRELGLTDVHSYQTYLEHHNEEWPVFDSLCRITISRFYRDKAVFQFLEREVMPLLARDAQGRGESELRAWSIGCASGEEPYTLALLWNLSLRRIFPDIGIRIVATDVDEGLIERAKKGCYTASSVKEIPKDWLEAAFVRSGNDYCIRDDKKTNVRFLVQDIRRAAPAGAFRLVLCRNIAFTYFNDGLQKEVLERIRAKLLPGGALVTGIHESLRGESEGFKLWSLKSGVYRRGGKKNKGPAP